MSAYYDNQALLPYWSACFWHTLRVIIIDSCAFTCGHPHPGVYAIHAPVLESLVG
jgi:hypothetical protein